MSRSFSLGFLTRVYSPTFSPQVYTDTVALFAAAERLGLDSGWVAQHHFANEEGRLPSPLLLLAAVSARTQRIQLGTGVIVLSQEPALRLAEDAAVLEILSGQRLQLGLGAGFDIASFLGFDQDTAQRHEDYERHLHHLTQYLRSDDSPLRPRPAPLSRKLWEATSRIEQAAGRGNGLIMAADPRQGASWKQRVDAYRQHFVSNRGSVPRIARVQAVFPGQDLLDPASPTRQDILQYVARQQASGVQPAHEGDVAALFERLGVLHGPVDGIIKQLHAQPAPGPDDQLIFQVQTLSTPLDQAVEALQIVARRIAPALGWHTQEP
jgi:alkanesulfonate monooxygenase SsuD/methylene tetrahydromethanopterin reductase-like flavin-dependent oxidoreductase (luciferase family)